MRSYESREWVKIIVKGSKISDRRAERPIVLSEYITEESVTAQLEKQNGFCCYCHDPMLYGEGVSRKQERGLTIQRINNELPHTRVNTVLVCFGCNSMAVSVPHEVCIAHGKELRKQSVRYCQYEGHCGNRLLPSTEFKKYPKQFESYCDPCMSIRLATAAYALVQAKKQDVRNGYPTSDFIDASFVTAQLTAQHKRCLYCQRDFCTKVEDRSSVKLSISPIDKDEPRTITNSILICNECSSMRLKGAKNIPHTVMLEYGADFISHKLRYCRTDWHAGERVVPWDMFAKNQGSCRECTHFYRHKRRRDEEN